MADGIDIGWEVAGQDDLVKGLEQSAKASDQVSAALEKQAAAMKATIALYQKMNHAQEKLAQTAGGGAGDPGRSAGGAGTRSYAGSSSPSRARPFEPLSPALGKASPLSDLGREIVRSEKQVTAKPPAFEKSLDTLLRSKRSGAGGFGPSGIGDSVLSFEGGPLGAAIEASKKAFEVFTAAMNNASEAGNKFGTLQNQTGSSSQVTGVLSNFGITADQVSAFNARISAGGDPIAGGVASKFGISNAPGPFGSQDWGSEYAQALKRVHDEYKLDPRAGLSDSRVLGLPDAVTNLSDTSFRKKFGADADAQASTFTPQRMQQTAEYANSQERLGQAFTNFTARIGQPFLSAMTRSGNEYTDLFNGKQTLRRFATGEGEDQYGNVADAHTQAIRENTQATKAMSGQLGVMGRQYGHGERTDQAIPRAYGVGSGYNLERNLHALSRQLGAFG